MNEEKRKRKHFIGNFQNISWNTEYTRSFDLSTIMEIVAYTK